MGSTGRRRLPQAVISPAAAYFMSKAFDTELRSLGRGRSAHVGQEWLGLELLDAAEELEQRGQAWFESMKVDPDAEQTEVSTGRELTVAQAVEVIGIGERAVRKAAGKAITGRQVGGRRWLLEEWSVLLYRDRVSSERGARRNSA